MPYATPEELKVYTGAQPGWLRLADEVTLDAWLLEWIEKAEEAINEYTNDSWTDADLPSTINTAAIRFVANAIKAARRHRAEQVMRVDELTSGQLRPLSAADTFLTTPIKEDLTPYVKRRSSGQSMRIFRVRRRSEMEI